MNFLTKPDYVILVDGDNINWSYYDTAQKYARQFGNVGRTHLFGKLSSLYLDDWQRVFPADDVIQYDITENRKNSTDMRMLATALRLYFDSGVRCFFILSSDSDMEAIISNMPKDAKMIVGYVPQKTAAKYLLSLQNRGVECVDLDQLRGRLSSAQIEEICKGVMQAYIKYKLGSSFFSYDTVKQWMEERYPETTSLSVDAIIAQLKPMQLSFTKEGIQLS